MGTTVDVSWKGIKTITLNNAEYADLSDHEEDYWNEE